MMMMMLMMMRMMVIVLLLVMIMMIMMMVGMYVFVLSWRGQVLGCWTKLFDRYFIFCMMLMLIMKKSILVTRGRT